MKYIGKVKVVEKVSSSHLRFKGNKKLWGHKINIVLPSQSFKVGDIGYLYFLGFNYHNNFNVYKKKKGV